MTIARSARAILITGPTASGKSALALAAAERLGGVVINADSMQVYRELRILTARPSPEDEARVPHRLYGHVSVAEPYSVARWLGEVKEEVARCRAVGQRPVIVGGTGLYLKALVDGLSPVPAIPEAVRRRWREAAASLTGDALYRMLAERDPEMARRLKPGDRQRIARALEVSEATGCSLSQWQGVRGVPVLAPADWVGIVVMPPREDLYRRTDARFDAMVEAGALEEVATLCRLQVAPDMPAMRAIGVRPLRSYLEGDADLPAAIEAGKRETRRYVKRQVTWLKGHFKSWNWSIEHNYCKIKSKFMQLIDD
jgi:tRNA dimethylallyltransferase